MSLFKSLAIVAKQLIGTIGKVPLRQIIWSVLSALPELIAGVENLLSDKQDGLTADEAKVWIDDALEAFDETTGEGALTVLPGLSKADEEKALDHLKEFFRVIFYSKYGVK